jgi:hypothetical protein
VTWSADRLLNRIADELRSEATVISPHVVEPSGQPVFGPLAAAGPRAAGDPGEYALVVESIREGYELHYGTPRLLAGHDEDLALLAGDYLYARGLERLAALGDPQAVAELSDLISLSAACHAEGGRGAAAAPALWLAAMTAVGCGGGEAHETAKAALRNGDPGAADALLESARAGAAAAGIAADLERAAESIDLAVPGPADRG